MLRLKCIIFTLLALALSCSDGAKPANPLVAKVGGEPIYKTELDQALKFETSKYDTKIVENNGRLEEIKKNVLEDLIKNRILYQTAKKEGITVSESELSDEYTRLKSKYTEASFQKMLELKGIKYDLWREDKKRALMIDKLIEKDVLSKIEISDNDVKKYYNNHRKKYSHDDEVHARQILVDDPKLAEQIRTKIVAGENFAALAQEYSIAPEGKRGGDLGFFPRGRMPRIFDEACFPLPAGGLSPVVKSEFGYHIFKVVERRNAATVKLEDVKENIIARLKQEKIEEAFNAWYETIKKKTKVEIYEKN